MKNLIAKLGILVALVCATGCSMLEVEPTDVILIEDFYKNEQDIDCALNGVYATLGATQLYGGDMLARMGLSADIGYEAYTTDEGTVGYYDVVTTDTKIQNYWKTLYTGISRANLLLENLDGAEMSDEVKRERVRAEARFLKAYFHFMLTIRFGDVPYMDKSVESCSLLDLQVPQTKQRDVYMNVINEMAECVTNLATATEVESAGRISQTAAYGILARVCLYMAGKPIEEIGMYARAKAYAKKVIDSGLHALNPDYEQIFINLIQDKYDIKESMWEVEFWGNNETSYSSVAGRVGRDNGIQVSSSNTAHEQLGISIGALRATQTYIEMFSPEDTRRDWTIAPFTYSTTSGAEQEDQSANPWIRCCGKFRRSYELGTKGVNYTPINFPLLRYADVLLMYAEAVAADDSSSADEVAAAGELLNQVRRRGFGLDINTPNEAVDAEVGDRLALYDAACAERPLELGFELLRKDDLIRWGVFYNNMRDIYPTIPSGFTSSYYVAARQYYSNASARDVLWPIPYYEMSLNKLLEQNNGW
ncbi:MAG: RagB/SusD family nutrient uptake outer membrane protein [Tidjanibacter sp.]|nr:RagB/SusD family nutrient uptake outer membrane protein [Tidjanibacter sp.]